MKSTTVLLEDGTQLTGVLWVWRPAEGWFDLGAVDDADGLVRVDLKKVVWAIQERTWGRHRWWPAPDDLWEKSRWGRWDEDLLERARFEGFEHYLTPKP